MLHPNVPQGYLRDWTRYPVYDDIKVNKFCLIYKCLNGQCPYYLGSNLVRVSDI